MQRTIHSALEPQISVLVFSVVLPFICLVQYFLLGVLVFILARGPSVLPVLAIGPLVIGIVTFPYWRRTFFDRSFVGMDRPYSVKWSSDTLAFHGCFFDLTVPIERVTKWQVIGSRSTELFFMLRIFVLDANGKKQVLNLSTSMSNKQELLVHLEKTKEKSRSESC